MASLVDLTYPPKTATELAILLTEVRLEPQATLEELATSS